ncbi:MAG: molecular chaperone HtpG, partial [Myxococcota bacterium]
MAELGQLALHLPGLLSLLGEHLYSDPRVAFRELVQNAHDSVVRRRLELADDGDPVIRVRSYREGGRAYVCISDRGLGLTKSEIERFLATIGRGQTRELRAALSGSGGDVRELVGQFGVGLLSAFLVADQVRVRTRRAGGNTAETDTETDTEGWEWVCDGQQTYRLAPFAFSDPDRRGSDVVIRLRPDKEDAGASGALFRAIQHYCGFLPCPIEVDGEQLNREVPAWIAGARAMPAERLARLASGDEVEAPLARMALKPFTHAEYGDIDLQGVLVIPPDSHLSIREYGGVRVYIRHMLVTPRESELLPQWARFVCGLIDCPQLEPTASREAVRRNPLFHAVRVELGRQLLDFLRVLKQQPDWADVVRAHATLIKRDAVRSAVLFDAVSDEIPFETSQGTLTLPQVLERSNGTLYCYTDSEQARTMSLLLGASAIPVIDGRWYANAPFLRFYAEMRGVALV